MRGSILGFILKLILGVGLAARFAFGDMAGLWAAESQYNVVLILADDLGWRDLQCYGSDLHRTPHLDRLAGSSMRFTNAYAASPVCTPTRASIMTGQHPARLNMTIWREAAEDRGRRTLLEPVVLGDLPLEQWTLAEAFQAGGYRTGHVGKWHLGQAESYPENHGFEQNVGGTLWGAPQSFFHPFAGDQYFSGLRYVPGLQPSQPGDYLTDRLTDKALEFIDQVDERPFFLNLWYHSVHTPIECKPALVDKYRPLAADAHVHKNPHYAAMVESLDENVGRVLQHLERKQLQEKTIVLFLSDNGGFINSCKLHPELPVTSNAPLRSGKGACYEGGLRIPLIIHWPGQSRAGGVCDVPVSTCDLYPTLFEGLGLPQSSKSEDAAVLDGVDLMSLLHDQQELTPPRSLFFHYPHYYATTSPVSAIRVADWKLLFFYEDQHMELYNLRDDPGERSDLSAMQPERCEQLLKSLQTWLTSVDASLPGPR